MPSRFDLSLYLVTDPEFTARRGLLDTVAAAVAGGVHVGQDDLAPSAARAILGPHAIIGLSVNDGSQLVTVDAAVDYVGLGPIYPTGTKHDAAPALGAAGFAALRRRLACPVVAIGGIAPENAACAIAAGADGIAVVSAICAAADPRAAARSLRAVVDQALKARSGPRS